ncbi:MAG: type II toxin-antitoxin system VapC family toxin [bacterium]|nr:type II toxin-antitoxin system VapC family toxin [bacterium]
MVIDTSVVIAIFGDEPGAQRLSARIEAATVREMSMASYVEAATVLWTRAIPPKELDGMIDLLAITLVPVDEAQGRAAIQARITYGKGTGHPAHLNFGDTFTYALAKVRGAPLLFVGEDFSHTDLASALA